MRTLSTVAALTLMMLALACGVDDEVAIVIPWCSAAIQANCASTCEHAPENWTCVVYPHSLPACTCRLR